MNRKQQTASCYPLTGSLFSNSIWIQFQKSEKNFFFSRKFEHKRLQLHFLFRSQKVTDCLFYPLAAVYSRVRGQNVPMSSHCCLFIYWFPSTVIGSLGRLAADSGLAHRALNPGFHLEKTIRLSKSNYDRERKEGEKQEKNTWSRQDRQLEAGGGSLSVVHESVSTPTSEPFQTEKKQKNKETKQLISQKSPQWLSRYNSAWDIMAQSS